MFGGVLSCAFKRHLIWDLRKSFELLQAGCCMICQRLTAWHMQQRTTWLLQNSAEYYTKFSIRICDSFHTPQTAATACSAVYSMATVTAESLNKRRVRHCQVWVKLHLLASMRDDAVHSAWYTNKSKRWDIIWE
jgi:hypothetical protein